MTRYTVVETPIGPLTLTSDGQSLTALYLDPPTEREQASWQRQDDAPPFPEARRQLAAYFAGERTTFDLPLAPRGSDFQRRVWDELSRIPYGATLSYGEVARRIGRPGAARAVGRANGTNPLPIVVPCHRVIGADGTLTGFGGGLPRKKRLLALETKVVSGQSESVSNSQSPSPPTHHSPLTPHTARPA